MTENASGEQHGHCLCGAVKITAKSDNHDVGACHCDMCRRWAGGPLMAISCGTDVVIEGEDNIGIYDSSPWADRGFCKQCGSNLFYRVKENGHMEVLAGLFDETDDMVFQNQVFIDEKPAFYSFAEKTETMTGAEVFAMVQEQMQTEQ